MKRIIVFTALILSLLGMESCKTTVATRPAQPAVVVRPPQPRPEYIWIDGEWYRSGSKYQFRQGYWAPPKGGRSWKAGRWEKRKGGWYWEKGKWK